MKLFIDYFTSDERKGRMYVDALKFINTSDLHFAVDSKNEFLDHISNRDLTDITHVTILTHGSVKTDHICKDDLLVNAIGYAELIEALNSTRNGTGIILNLAGICMSVRFVPFIETLDNRFAEIWISEENTPYIEKPVYMVYEGFDHFIYDKEEEDIFFRKKLNSN